MSEAVVQMDVSRMRKERLARLHDVMADEGLDALLLLGTSNAAYASSITVPGSDQSRAQHERNVLVVEASEQWPALFTSFSDLVPPEWPLDRVRAHVDLDRDGDAQALVASLPSGRIGVDDLTPALHRALRDREMIDASIPVGAAKVVKTPDELEGIRRAQSINEAAMHEVLAMVAPGVRTAELTSRFLRGVLDLGASHNVVQPVFQVMPRSIAAGPHSVTGDPVYPTPPVDHTLEAGDVIWVDTGLDYETLSSDFGRTWIVGAKPDARQRAQFEQWRAVLDASIAKVRPGATAGDLARAAREVARGGTPWLSYFYLAHGCGTASAEMPLVGTDLGEDFDDSLVLEQGMVLVFEPVIWEDGHGGYRSEDIVAVTDTGSRMLSDFPYTPFDS